MFDVYKPSGRFGLLTLPLMVAAMIATGGLAFVYQMFLDWIPLIYINGLLSAGFGLVLGFFGSMIVYLGKVRNPLLAACLGLVLTVTAIGCKFYFQYQTMLGAVTTQWMELNQIPQERRATTRHEISQQLTFRDHIQARVDEGWHVGRGGQGGIPIQGPLVYLIWLIEVGLVGYFAVRMPASNARDPFSEKINAWANEEEVVMTLPISDPAMVEKIKSVTSVSELLEIPIPKSDESHQFAVYTVYSLPGQELEDAYLSVKLVTWGTNKQGEPESSELPLVRYAVLPTAQRKTLNENASLLQEALAEYRRAVEEEEAAATEDEEEGGMKIEE